MCKVYLHEQYIIMICFIFLHTRRQAEKYQSYRHLSKTEHKENLKSRTLECHEKIWWTSCPASIHLRVKYKEFSPTNYYCLTSLSKSVKGNKATSAKRQYYDQVKAKGGNCHFKAKEVMIRYNLLLRYITGRKVCLAVSTFVITKL